MKQYEKRRRKRLPVKGVNSFLACTASLMLTGVPPIVCESVLDEIFCSVRKSMERIKM